MKKALSLPLQISLCTVGYLWTTGSNIQAEARPALGEETSPSFLAQVTTDGTVNTIVTPNENVAEITGGETRGSNLFHSFQEFSVSTGNEAFFNNANDISNIFSRVTGGNISNIDGVIRANGTASLFLINPAGIIFGENASLSIGGSFYGSTADSILFEGGEFSAVNNIEQPILTVNAPIGLSFRDNPGDIVNRSRVENSEEEVIGLEINSGNNLAFIGGNLNFESGNATASGGNIYLGGLAEAGIVDLNQDGSLTFPDNLTKTNINLTDGSLVDVRGTGGGNITINAQNLNLEAGEFASSFIRAGVTSDSNSAEAQAGNLAINVAEKITLNESFILNQVGSGGVGNSGNITITTGSIEAINGGGVDASTFAQGNAGAVEIIATGDLKFDGETSGGIPSGVTSLVLSNAEGESGGVTISTNNLTLTNGGRVAADTFGKGDAGAVEISAMGNIRVDGEDSQGFKSGLTSIVNQGAKGDGGDITISVTDLSLNNGGRISTISFSQGDSGDIFIQADENISLSNGNIVSLINPGGMGTAGNIDIETNSLSLNEGGQIQSGLFRTDGGLPGGQGLGGNITVTSKDYIDISGLDSDSFSSSIISITEQGASGDAGDIILNTGKLLLSDSGNINAATRNSSNAGDIIINASSFEATSGGQIRATTARSSGNAGNITLNINGSIDISGSDPTFNQRLEQFGEDFVSDAGAESGLFVNAANNSTGQAGSLLLNAEQLNLSQQGTISASTQVGNGGNISLMISKDIILENNSLISAQAFNQANGGNLDIDARFVTAFPSNGTGNDLVATADAGKGGNINLNAEQIFGLQERDAIDQDNNFLANNTNDIDASSNIDGLDGSVTITTLGFDVVQGARELPNNLVESEQTTAQACEANRELAAKNRLNITGKGGVPPAPDLPFDSLNVFINGESSNSISAIPQPIETSQGKIQPARGIKVTKDGGIVLTAYRTNNAGDRLPEDSTSCGGV